MSKHDRRKTLSYLNVFNYYDGGHEFEDNLTRAFLVLLKNSPFIMKRFADVIVAHSNEEVRAIDWCSDLHEVKIESQPGKVSDEDLCEFTVPVIITEKKLDHIPQVSTRNHGSAGTRPSNT